MSGRTGERMLILGIESSCDETAAAVVEGGVRVRSNVIASQFEVHEEYGGVVPELASRAHAERILPVVRRAVAEAELALNQIDAIAVGHRPGLIGSLLVGVAAAKALSWSLGKPLVGVDHVHAHMYAGWLRSDGDTPANTGGEVALAEGYPALGLVVSGGHTALYRCDSPADVSLLGATIDDAMGEAFDKAATILGLPYPGGPNLDRLASSPGANDRAHDFPISRLAPGSLDFSFSGLKTAVLYAVRGTPGAGGTFSRDHTAISDDERRDLAASFQRAAARAALIKLDRAVAKLRDDGVPIRTLLAGGGVTANTRLRAELTAFAADQGIEMRLPHMEFCVDNAAMIAGLGYYLLRGGRQSDLSLAAAPSTTR